MIAPINILLIEDDPFEVESLRRRLAEFDRQFSLTTATDGEAGLALLRGTGDWRLPKMDGGMFLRELRGDPLLRSSIVFVITHSDDDYHKVAAYGSSVAGYMRKAKLGRDFEKLIELLLAYRAIVQFPIPDHQANV